MSDPSPCVQDPFGDIISRTAHRTSPLPPDTERHDDDARIPAEDIGL